MILNWISSKEVVSRIVRNIKNIQAEYMDDILEWIPEALLKLKTQYSLEVRPYEIQIEHHQGLLPSRIDGLIYVQHNGHRLNYNDRGQIRKHHPDSAGFSLFQSTVPIPASGNPTNIQYTSSGDKIASADNSTFPRDIIEKMETPWDPHAWYKVNGRYLETSIECGCITAWIQEIPKSEEGYPLIPDNEYMGEAIYRYCRMMLIEAGYEDPIISHKQCKEDWTDAAGKAIADTCFPTPDQVQSSIERHVQDFFPDGSEMYNSW